MDRVPCICKSEENANHWHQKGNRRGGEAHTFCNQSNVCGIAVSPMLIRSSYVLTLMSVRVYVGHVLVDGVTFLRSCRCSPRVLCETTTNTRWAPSWKHGNYFDIGSVGIAPISWSASQLKHTGLVKNVGHYHKYNSTAKLDTETIKTFSLAPRDFAV
jgi:hypothetical protein